MREKILTLVLILVLLLGAAMAETAVIPFGEKLEFETQITPDGKARLQNEADYATLRFTIRMKGNRGPMHFKKFYGEDFALKGSEAVAEFELSFTGKDMEINPNNVILLTLQAENGETASGYRMTNWEMAGSTDLPMTEGLNITAFKRYDFDEDDENPMRYLVVHSFNDGVEQTYLMDMLNPKAENTFTIIYPELKRKSRGSAVKELQAKLKELGLLSGSSVDGVYGPGTAESVKAAQKLLGFEETGVATHEFQKALYKYQMETVPEK